jgi:hypothetical protein
MRLKNASKEYILTKKKNKRYSRKQIVKRSLAKRNLVVNKHTLVHT